MKKLILLLTVGLLLSSCSRRPENEVALNSRNFGDEVQVQQNLSFTFSHDLVPEERIGRWDSVDYARIEPEVQGRFKWESKQVLVFSPNKGFDPSTEYTIRINDAVLDFASEKKLYLAKELKEGYTFHTPYLKPESLSAYWTRDKASNQVKIGVKLLFNYPVDPGSLQPFLELYADDTRVDWEVSGSGASRDITVMANPGDKGKEDVLLRAKVKEGLPIAGMEKTSKQVQEVSQVLPSRLRLDIQDITATYENGTGTILVETSQSLINTDLSACFGISPQVATTTRTLDNGFSIEGPFDLTQVYTLTLNTKLEGELGGKLEENYIKKLSFGELKPSLTFTHQDGIYLSSKGQRNIGIHVVNVEEVHVTVYKIFENNILSYLRHKSYGDWDYDYELEEYVYQSRSYSEDDEGHYSQVILEKDIHTSGLPKVNGVRLLNLDLPGGNNEYRGIYYVKVNSKKERYVNASKLVSVSDVGLITKVMDNKVMVMAHSILDTRALGDVEVSLVSKNNQIMMRAKTDNDGIVVFDDLEKNASGFEPAMVTVRSGNDFNFAPFSDTRVESSRFDVGGRYKSSTGFDAYIYGPRNLYRPGERIDLNTIIRTEAWESPNEIPVKLKLIMPNGKEFKSEKAKTNKQGAVETHFDLPDFAQTGYYRFQVYNGNDALLNTYSVQVEEFMPDRLRIKPKLDRDRYNVGDTVHFSAFVQNLYGPPAANRKYELTYQFDRRNYISKQYPEYSFHGNERKSPSGLVREGKTGSDGMIREDLYVDNSFKGTGMVSLDLYCTAFDESGRPVNIMKSTSIYTQKTYFGIRLEDYYVSTRSPVTMRFVAVDSRDKFSRGAKAELELIRLEWQNVIESGGSHYRYRSVKVEKTVLKKNITFGSSPYELAYTPLVSGEYEVRIKEPGSNGYAYYRFYAYGWGNTQSGSFKVDSEGQIEMETDKDHYEVGDQVKVLLKTPFSGKVLVSIERDDVFEYKVIETDKKSAEFTFTLKDEHAPNVYVAATLFRPMDGTGMPLTVAHGYVPVMAEKKSSRLPLEIMAVDKSRSKTKQKITIKSKPSSDIEVTFAAVDEGILQLRNFDSPDPHAFFYRKRALEVTSYDIYEYLLPELSSKKSTGGGAGAFKEGGQKRANPLANKRVKLVSKWSGILRTNSRGEATYELDIPQFNGELRLMAVAWKDGAFGSASKSMTVADPLVVNTGLPRFLSPNDEVSLPVNVANTTGKSANTRIRIKTSGPLEVNGSSGGELTVAANEEGVSTFTLKAKPDIGAGKITVEVSGLGETFTEELDITVRPAAPLTFNHYSGMLEAGNHPITLGQFNDMIPQSRSVHVLVSRSPLTQFTKELKKLLGYPHGCVEQTTSKAFPQLYLAQFIKEHVHYLSDEDELNPEFNVRAAITKLSSMQQYNGAMSYWPGSYNESYWGTVFATHFLLEAKKAGYEVNQNVLDKALSYLSYKNREKYSEPEWYMHNGMWTTRRIVNRAQVYGLYVLALAGKADKPLMNHYKANASLLASDSRYLLGAAFAMIGDRKSFEQLAPIGFPNETLRAELGGNFASNVRNMAISLHTLIEVDPDNKQIPDLTRMLSEQFKLRRYHNTQELVFTLLSLGKLYRSNAGSNSSAIVKAGNKIIGRFDGSKDLKILRDDIEDGHLSIEVNGSGKLYYYAEVSGIPANGEVDERDNYLRVRRSFYDRFGNPITNNRFTQNQLVVVKISVSSIMGTSIENVAVTDMLPAGFEVENPRLNDLPGMDWIRDKSSPDYYDFRDDRVNLYMEAFSSQRNYYYMVRAVSKGRYRLGPVAGDAMYNGEYHSYHGSGWITIE